MSGLFSFVIRFLFHMIVLYGCWLIFKPLLDHWLKNAARNLRFTLINRFKFVGKRLEQEKRKSWFISHIDRLLYLTHKDYQPGVTSLRFIALLIFLFVGVFFISFLLIGELPAELTFNNPFAEGVASQGGGKIVLRFPFLIALFITSIPYITLRYNYSKKSVQSTYDLLDVVKLLAKYADLSLDVALERTAKILPDNNVLKQPVRSLSLVFSNYANEHELQIEMNRFSQVINSAFAIDLSMNLLYLQHHGAAYLKDYLVNLYQTMEEQRATILRVKESARDAISLGTYGNLIVFVLSISSLIMVLGLRVYYKLQFQTEVGLAFFFIIITTFVVSVIVAALLSKSRLDYH